MSQPLHSATAIKAHEPRQASALYKRALFVDEHCADAAYNLGVLAAERGRTEVLVSFVCSFVCLFICLFVCLIFFLIFLFIFAYFYFYF